MQWGLIWSLLYYHVWIYSFKNNYYIDTDGASGSSFFARKLIDINSNRMNTWSSLLCAGVLSKINKLKIIKRNSMNHWQPFCLMIAFGVFYWNEKLLGYYCNFTTFLLKQLLESLSTPSCPVACDNFEDYPGKPVKTSSNYWWCVLFSIFSP